MDDHESPTVQSLVPQEPAQTRRDEDVFQRVHVINETIAFKSPAAPGAQPGMPDPIFQFIMTQLKENWAPVGWQENLSLNERVKGIMEMYVHWFIFYF
jgi:hypothetical protein